MVSDTAQRAVAQIHVTVNGAAMSEEMLADLTEAVVDDGIYLPDMAVLRIDDDDFRWSDSGQLEIGQELKVELGSNDFSREVFVGEITTIEQDIDSAGVPSLIVRAYDRSHRLQRGRDTRVFKRMSDSEIASQIARDRGLRPDVDATRPVHDYVLQNNVTDLEFLQERARRVGFELIVSDKTLIFKRPPGNPLDPIDLALNDNLVSFHATLAASEQVSEVEVRGWDPIQKRESVGSARRGETTMAIEERSSGGDLAARSFSDSPKLVVVREHLTTKAEADALAQAALNEIAQAFVQADGEAIGDPRLRAGGEVNVASVGDRFSGRYFVTSARHIYRQDGYSNEFVVSGRRPTDVYSLLAPPEDRTSQILTGVVTNNSDPRDRGRVKVKLPALGEAVESDWCRIVAPGAGNNRGVEFLPEIDDEVLLIGSDVNQLFVLGGLWNQIDRPPELTTDAISGGSVDKRVIRSRTGHTVLLDDSAGSPGITIVDSTGNNRIALDTQSNNLELAVDGDIKISARGSIEITAQRDLKLDASGGLSASAGSNASLEAGSQLSLKGTASATLEAGARAEVKAPTIGIGP